MFGILRTLLAINVVLLHIFNVPALGNYSVSFFFLLSGFLMTYIMQETYGFTFRGFKIYWLNRILRLYPVYFIVLIITVGVLFVFSNIITHPDLFLPKSTKQWLANISLVYPNFIPHRFEPRLSPPSWALTNELFFYLLISLGISKTKLRTFFWLLASIGYFIGTYIYYDIATYRYSAILASSLPFALGATLYWINKTYPLKKVSIIMIAFLYIIFVLNANFSTIYSTYIKDLTIYFNMVIAFFLIYLLFNFKTNRRLKSIDNYVGLYSYPIYLSHYVVAIIYSGLIGYGVLNNNFKMSTNALVPYFIILFIFCLLIVHFVDNKVNKYKKKIKRKYSK